MPECLLTLSYTRDDPRPYRKAIFISIFIYNGCLFLPLLCLASLYTALNHGVISCTHVSAGRLACSRTSHSPGASSSHGRVSEL